MQMRVLTYALTAKPGSLTLFTGFAKTRHQQVRMNNAQIISHFLLFFPLLPTGSPVAFTNFAFRSNSTATWGCHSSLGAPPSFNFLTSKAYVHKKVICTIHQPARIYFVIPTCLSTASCKCLTSASPVELQPF